MENYLQNIKFLKKICKQQNQKIFGKIYSLDQYENILQNLTGIIQTGSINLDGSSAIRRTCSLTILLDSSFNINNILFLNEKIKIEIGIENFTNEYLDNKIIWFPMGIYYLTDFTINNTAQGVTLNLNAKDKMIKLTGDLGGTFNSTIEFGVINAETNIKGKFVKNKIKIKTIITEMVHTYGHEPYEKIFIYDLDDYGLNSISYQGEEPIYAFLKEENDKIIIVNYVFDADYQIYDSNSKLKKLSSLTDKDFFISKYTILNTEQEYSSFYLNKNGSGQLIDGPYYIKKCNKGDTIGYELAELTYIDDLVAAPGENVTSILNKILNILGKDNYEYYYDLDGNFIFKKQDQFVQIESYLNPFVSFSKPDIQFTDNLIINKTESFDLSKIKNDFTVWGKKNNSDQQFHVRLAIDKKPEKYISILIDENKEKELKEKYPNLYGKETQLQQQLICYSVNEKENNWSNESTWKQVDWREIIYQMAQDYKKFNQLSDFYQIIENNNPEYINGITGYERYYIDLDSFWRELYVPEKKKVNLDDILSENNFYDIDFKNFNIKYINTRTKISIQDFIDKSGIEVSTGELIQNSYYYKTTDFIDVSKYKTIKFYSPMPYLKNGKEPQYGYCFYTENKTLIEGSGKIFSKRKNQREGEVYEIKEIEVPDKAKYFRTTYWNNDILKHQCFPQIDEETGQLIIDENGNLNYEEGYSVDESNVGKIIPEFKIWVTALKNVEYDIISNSLDNQNVYKKSEDKDGNILYENIGLLNDIIATNYKILEKMYKIISTDNNDYLISEDVDTKEIQIWNNKEQNLLWLLSYNINLQTQTGINRMNSINNKIWKFLKENKEESELLGTYYDITSLYIQTNINIKYGATELSESEITNYQSFSKNEDSISYEKIKKYPTNKQGNSLTNIQNFKEDINGLILLAKENNRLTYISKEINQDTHYNKKIYDDPSNLIFWFDFLDDTTFSQSHAIQNIGPREYVQTKGNVNSIINLYTLDNIFLNYKKDYTKDENAIQNFYSTSFAQKRNKIPFFRLAKKDNKLFKISSNSISAIDLINNYIYNYNYMSSQVNIKAISQYFLQPNSLFDIVDLENQSLTTYIANKISFSFGVSPNIQMTINGIKLVDFNYVQQDLRKEIINE